MPASTSHKIIILIFFLLCRCLMLLAEDPAAKDIRLQNTVDNPLPQGDFERLTIPLKRVQNLFMIEARIDSVQGNFIFDTGAPHMVLNKTYFRKGKLSEGTSAGAG